jgi:hypothetical protein
MTLAAQYNSQTPIDGDKRRAMNSATLLLAANKHGDRDSAKQVNGVAAPSDLSFP